MISEIQADGYILRSAIGAFVVVRRLKSPTPVKGWVAPVAFAVIAVLFAVQSIKVSTVAICLVKTYTYLVLMMFQE